MRGELLLASKQARSFSLSLLTMDWSPRRRRWRLLPVPIAPVNHIEPGSLESHPAVAFGPEHGIKDSAGEQSALGRPGRSAGVHHLLDSQVEVGEVHERTRLLRPESGRLRLSGALGVLLGVAPGDCPFVNPGSGSHQTHPQTVSVVDYKEHRIGAEFFDVGSLGKRVTLQTRQGGI